MKHFFIILLMPFFLFAHADRAPVAYDFLSKKEVKNFIAVMAKRYHFKRRYLISILKNARLDRDTLMRYSGKFRPNTTIGSWERFKRNVVNKESFKKAKQFKKNYFQSLKKAEKIYKVDMDYIVGFLGVESQYGTFTGEYNILDALATLAFHPNRMQKLFKSELKHLFLFAREKKYDIRKLKGSFAGAMGCVQQLPSIARKFNHDFDGDGASVWDIEDCIGSIAKFMHRYGWEKGAVTLVAAKYNGKRFRHLKSSHKRMLPLRHIQKFGVTPRETFPYNRAYLLKTRNHTHDDIWLGGPNFKILTRYNNSSNYGIAICLIAKSIR